MNNLAEEMPKLVEKLKDGYKKYEDENGVIPVPEDYDISKQLIKNSERGKLH
jgi:arylsulfatase